MIAQVKPSIVAIGTVQHIRRPPRRFRATAFVVGDGNHAITNAHALPNAADMQAKEWLAIFLPGKQSPRRATVVEIDQAHDLALVAFDGRPLPVLRLGSSRRVAEGQSFVFTGYPIGGVLGLYPVTHRAMVSAVTPIAIPQASARGLSAAVVKRLSAPFKILQLDATAYPGNSGSPLMVPGTGEVVGVLNKVLVRSTRESALERPTGISYAIPVEHAIALVSRAGLASR